MGQVVGRGGEREGSSVQNSGRTITLIEICNNTYLVRSFKDKIIENKQVDYNSDRLSNLDRQAAIFLIHRLLNF